MRKSAKDILFVRRIIEKGIILNVLESGHITPENSLISSEKWIDALSEYEKDIKYEKICKGHLKLKMDSGRRPSKYSKIQLSEALKL